MEVNRVFAWTDPAAEGGVVAAVIPGLGLVPLFYTDAVAVALREQTCREQAKLLAAALGRPLQLVEFHRARVVETVP